MVQILCLIASSCSILYEQLLNLSREDFKAETLQIDIICKIENFCIEALTWYTVCGLWKHSNEFKMLKASR